MNRKGYTLVEMIVAFALLAIFAASSIAIVAPILNYYRRVASAADGQMIAGNILDEIRGRVTKATQIQILEKDGEQTLDLGDNVLSVQGDGYLAVNGLLHFAPSYYNGKSISLSFSVQDPTKNLHVSVTVWQQGQHLCTVDAVMSSLHSVLST